MSDQRIAELEAEVARLRDVKAIVRCNQDLDQENERLRDEVHRVEGLRAQIKSQRKQLHELNEVLRRKNLELDALHMVWCDGGCVGGVHRWTDEPVTEEVVATAERNTARLRHWYDTAMFRIGKAPIASEWHQEYAERLKKKIGEE